MSRLRQSPSTKLVGNFKRYSRSHTVSKKNERFVCEACQGVGQAHHQCVHVKVAGFPDTFLASRGLHRANLY